MTAGRILVVEDEFLIACSLEEDLRAFGYDVVGPFHRLETALEGSRLETIDAAVLDVNLNGTMVFPLADELRSRHIPIVFLSGYGFGFLPPRFAGVPQLSKPSDPKVVAGELRRLLPPRR